MRPALDSVQADFDRIAAAGHVSENDHNSHFDKFVITNLPDGAGRVLDAGCGGGRLTRLVAGKCGSVLGMDLSPGMIEAARKESGHPSNVEFQVGDFTKVEGPKGGFDAIVSVAALHHVDLRQALDHLGSVLSSGGRLIVVDLFDAKRLTMLPYAAACYVHMLLIAHELKRSKEELAAWDDHFRRDRFDPIGKIERIARDVLPGSRVRVGRLWRYTLVWDKP